MTVPQIDWTHPDRLFRYHAPSPEAVEQIRETREAFYDLALKVQALPSTPERTLALRALHEAQHHAIFTLVGDQPTEAHPSETATPKAD